MDVSKAIDKARNSGRDEVLRVTAWIRAKRDELGLKTADLDAAAETAGMAGHWVSQESQPAIPTLEQWQKLEPLLGEPPEWMRSLLLPARKPGDAWEQREVIGRATDGCGNTDASMHKVDGFAASRSAEYDITAPATDAARQWAGWGTALKPAFEPALLFRKPLDGNVAQNVMKHGTGALNIDGCRVPAASDADAKGYADKCASVVGLDSNRNGNAYGQWKGERSDSASSLGRFPANLIHDGSPEVLACFPDSDGAGPSLPRVKVTGYGGGIGSGVSACTGGERIPFDAGSGSAARFFYAAKSNKRDRNEGCEGVETGGSADLSRLKTVLNELQKAMCADTTPSTDDPEWSTSLFGSGITGPCQTAIRSIIETALKTTTESKTSNCSRPWSTSVFIRAATAIARGNGLSLAELAESTSGLKQNTTDARMESVLRAVSALLLALSETSKSARLGNAHETVKPTDLMRYLCRLVTPPGGVVLDPFAGSGSTGKAAILEGFRFIGCELSDEYANIAEARISHTYRGWQEDRRQGSLFGGKQEAALVGERIY